jgi:hypothetical protein
MDENSQLMSLMASYIQTFCHLKKKLYAGEGLLPWPSPNFRAYTLRLVALKPTTLKLGKALGACLSPYITCK